MEDEPRQEQWKEERESEVRKLYLTVKHWLEQAFEIELTPIEAVRLRSIIREQILPIVTIQEKQNEEIKKFWGSLEEKYGERWFEEAHEIRPFWKEVLVPRMMTKMNDPILETFWAFINEVWGVDYPDFRDAINSMKEGLPEKRKEAIEQKAKEIIQKIRLQQHEPPELKEADEV